MKRISLIGSNLRHRSDIFKADLVNKFNQNVTPLLASGDLKPVVDKVFKVDLSNSQDVSLIEEAHQYMENNQNIGKIILSFEGRS